MRARFSLRSLGATRSAGRSAIVALAALGALAGCGGGSSSSAVAAELKGIEADRAAAVRLLGEQPMADRFEVVAVADRLAVAAVREGKGGSAAKLAELAAELRERAFRVGHGDADAREAAALLERVAENGSGAEICDAAIHRAALLGEIARDPAVSLRELSSSFASCGAPAEALASSLGAFRARAGISPAPAASAMTSPFAPEEIVASPESPPPSNEPVRVQSIVPYGDVDAARVVVELSGSTSFQAGIAAPIRTGAGPRVFVDIAQSKLGKLKKDLQVNGLVERVRVAPHGSGTRVVLDLAKPANRRIFYLTEPFRVVIDVSARRADAPIAPSLAVAGRRRLARVVLDPGHGGHDPGATGPSGLHEKDVTLDVAHRAAPVLARELGVSTLLTRDSDDYVSLEERTARANAFGADVFVSIHCNASESSAARGVQTFVLDTTSDDIAARVAARENSTSARAGTEVTKLLASLKLADLGSRSTHLAELLQRATLASLLDRYPGTIDQGVRNAGFYVLVGAQMPAVLFETSFVSNAIEEQRLGTPDYRQRLADAIVNAVRAYAEGR